MFITVRLYEKGLVFIYLHLIVLLTVAWTYTHWKKYRHRWLLGFRLFTFLTLSQKFINLTFIIPFPKVWLIINSFRNQIFQNYLDSSWVFPERKFRDLFSFHCECSWPIPSRTVFICPFVRNFIFFLVHYTFQFHAASSFRNKNCKSDKRLLTLP